VPRKRLSMRKISEVLRLRWDLHASQREIANSCKIGQATVNEYLRRAKAANLTWPLPPDLTEEELERRLFPPPVAVPASARPVPDWAVVQKELRRKGVTLLLLWEEYAGDDPNAYRYSWFQERYRQWEAIASPRLHIEHAPGDKLFVDYAGQTVDVLDKPTGEMRKAQIYVATMGASNYTYAEATWTQTIPDWIASNIRALEFFGGAPRAIVPDNLKSGVKSADYYEPDLNPTFREWALHYGVAILPTRVRKPTDKGTVEKGVQMAEQRLLAPLRNRCFFSLEDLNAALRGLLDVLNLRDTRDLPASRKAMFEATDRPALRALPPQRFEEAVWSKATVHQDYHVDVERHYYSVHYTLIGEAVEVRLTSQIVEIFHKNARVASHKRSTVKYRCTTLPQHRPANHAFVLGVTDDWLLECAQRVGPRTHEVVRRALDEFEYPEEAYRRCQGLLRLARQNGSTAMEAVCAIALQSNVTGYRSIKAMLANLAAEPHNQTAEPTPIQHDNIRGSDYYRDSANA
jgi:transposase